MIEFNRVLKLVRSNANLSQQEVATLLGVTKAYISFLEKGKKEPSLKLIKDFSHAFKIPVFLLLWDGFSLPKNHTKSDEKIQKIIEELIPQLQNYLFERITKSDTVQQ